MRAALSLSTSAAYRSASTPRVQGERQRTISASAHELSESTFGVVLILPAQQAE